MNYRCWAGEAKGLAAEGVAPGQGRGVVTIPVACGLNSPVLGPGKCRSFPPGESLTPGWAAEFPRPEPLDLQAAEGGEWEGLPSLARE